MDAVQPRAKNAADEAALAAHKEGIVAAGEEAEAKSKKRKAESKESTKLKKVDQFSHHSGNLLTVKSAPSHLQFWSNRHAELHGIKSKDTDVAEDNNPSQDATSKPTKTEANKSFVQSYANLAKKCCYLCSRQFKTEAEVNKHERLSELHRTNLKDENLKIQALAKMKKAGITPVTNAIADDDTPEYRDRAKERRAAFGSASKKVSLPMKKQADETGPADADSKPAKSKGAALLGKMGWNSGEGLGAQGTGITAPIATDVYAAGVGLGAQGGKLGDAVEEADRNTKGGYAEFVERAKDKAKERYHSMQ